MNTMFTVLVLITLLGSPAAASPLTMTAKLAEIGRGEAYYLSFIKVYEAILFSSENARTEGILHANVSKCLHLVYAVGVKEKDMVDAAWTTLEKQFSRQQLGQVESEIEEIHQGYRDVAAGDNYMLCYESGVNRTTLAYNGKEVATVDSPLFAEIYFSIWLGETKPLDDGLRDDLLKSLTEG